MVCFISKGVHYCNRGAQWCVLSPRGYIIVIGGAQWCVLSPRGVHYCNRGVQWCVLSPRGYTIVIGGHNGVFYLQGGTLL